MGVETAIGLFGFEDHPLALAERAEQGSLERAGSEKDLAAVVISYDDADTGTRVVGLDYALHGRALGFLDLAGFETGGAHPRPPGVGAVLDTDPLNIWDPASAGALVGEAHLLPVPGLFATDFTTVGHEKDDPPEAGAAG
jgi:hypothetical protein